MINKCPQCHANAEIRRDGDYFIVGCFNHFEDINIGDDENPQYESDFVPMTGITMQSEELAISSWNIISEHFRWELEYKNLMENQ